MNAADRSRSTAAGTEANREPPARRRCRAGSLISVVVLLVVARSSSIAGYRAAPASQARLRLHDRDVRSRRPDRRT